LNGFGKTVHREFGVGFVGQRVPVGADVASRWLGWTFGDCQSCFVADPSVSARTVFGDVSVEMSSRKEERTYDECEDEAVAKIIPAWSRSIRDFKGQGIILLDW